METLHTWWATELYPMRERDQFGVSGEFEVVLATDAQAAIAALQARVQELRQVIERVAHHGPIMGSRGEYRQGQLDVLESVRRIVQEELYGSHQITG